MAPPTRDELANRRQAIERAVAQLDPHGTTPAILRDLIIEMGAQHQQAGGLIIQTSMGQPQPQPPQGQQGQNQQGHTQPAQGQGRGQGAGGRGQSGAGTGRGTGTSPGQGSSGQQ